MNGTQFSKADDLVGMPTQSTRGRGKDAFVGLVIKNFDE